MEDHPLLAVLQLPQLHSSWETLVYMLKVQNFVWINETDQVLHRWMFKCWDAKLCPTGKHQHFTGSQYLLLPESCGLRFSPAVGIPNFIYTALLMLFHYQQFVLSNCHIQAYFTLLPATSINNAHCNWSGFSLPFSSINLQQVTSHAGETKFTATFQNLHI
jgi:hypothetical protein